MSKFIKNGTVVLENKPSVKGFAAAVGKNEGEGPLGEFFDFVSSDDTLGEESWEKAEKKLQQLALEKAAAKAKIAQEDIDFLFAGDLLNQCVSSGYNARELKIPFAGLYGACSTMAESLCFAAIFADNLLGDNLAALTSSHFCSAERQFRFPLNYGGVRTPTAQWTATASGCAIVGRSQEPPYLRAVTFGCVKDMGVTDTNNMGAAMAMAAYETISTHLKNTGLTPRDFDLILTGDLGKVGSDILVELFAREKTDISAVHNDCGMMLYNPQKQDVHAGGSGCGCSASVLCGYVLDKVRHGELKNVLFAATGALMSPTVLQQGESIPGISHAVQISAE